MRKGTGIMKTPKPLLALRMVFPLAASLIVLLLGKLFSERCRFQK